MLKARKPRRNMTKLGHFRPFSLALVALLLSFGTLFVTSGTAQADPSCPDDGGGYSCFWIGGHFGDAKRLIGAGEPVGIWKEFDNRKYSVKNRFTAWYKTIWIYGPQIGGDGIDCGYPGQRIDSIPGGVTWYAIGDTCGGRLTRHFVY